MSNVWHARDAYELAYVGGVWLVLVRGGAHVPEGAEPTFRVEAQCPDRDEGIRVRNALRATL